MADDDDSTSIMHNDRNSCWTVRLNKEAGISCCEVPGTQWGCFTSLWGSDNTLRINTSKETKLLEHIYEVSPAPHWTLMRYKKDET